MCIYYYLHHHHVSPCRRAIDYVVHYEFCPDAVWDSEGKNGVPCDCSFYDQAQSVDYSNPCATSGCLVSPDCSSGTCRLQDLGGCWICCQCQRGNNVLRWCGHKMRKSPDTFCYHRACEGCTQDTRE
ncbi:hypothetical protein EV126DRAFT_349653 [Verticillium dahliae]|nr:hypothetical protein EV126DRAFT_349653 [Verticillium dahliae]